MPATNRAAGSTIDGMTWAAAGLLLASILLGGGGAEAPLLNGLLQAGGGVLLCAAAARHFTGRPLPGAAIVPVMLLVLLLLWVMVQLIPLPPSWWSGLPGRQAAASIYALVGSEPTWRPLSLDPEATRRFAAALLLPAGLFLAAMHARHDGLILLGRTVVLGALLSALVAGVQLVPGMPSEVYPYGRPGAGVPTGVFANPNHQGQLMIAAIVMTGLLIHFNPAPTGRPRHGGLPFHVAWMLFPIFTAAALATQSRAVLILLVPGLIAGVLIAARRRGLARLFGLSTAAIAALAAVAAIFPGGLSRGMELQMELNAGGRIANFPDLRFTLEQYWPWGSGFGTFVPVFKADENLDLMGDLYLNHAHNDLLELLIEGGLPMAILLIAGLIAMAVRLWRLVTAGRPGESATALTGFTIILLALIHSLVDYPLRMHSLAAVAAVALALFQSPAAAGQRNRRPFWHPGFEPDHRRSELQGAAKPVAG